MRKHRLPNGIIMYSNAHEIGKIKYLVDNLIPGGYANLYVAPKFAMGIKHADPYDVTAVQLKGTKMWYFGNYVKAVMYPEIIVIPAGLEHQAQAGPQGSVHLAIRTDKWNWE
jgi:hypothetical protein